MDVFIQGRTRRNNDGRYPFEPVEEAVYPGERIGIHDVFQCIFIPFQTVFQSCFVIGCDDLRRFDYAFDDILIFGIKPEGLGMSDDLDIICAGSRKSVDKFWNDCGNVLSDHEIDILIFEKASYIQGAQRYAQYVDI